MRKTRRGKGYETPGSGRPLWSSSRRLHGICFAPHEVKLAGRTITERFTDERPKKMIGDKAYDCDPLDEQLKKLDVDLIAPHKRNRKKAATQDGQSLCRCKRRRKVERLFAWLQNFRRIIVRCEYHPDNYLGFVLLGGMLILLKNYF